ncbi:hypothetical protein JB92DRAFT_3125303 [Gautieria morchelliformis]|nr:hypothetical protein JB92DRAFT_3125303 [Gautieria morchelliformis]
MEAIKRTLPESVVVGVEHYWDFAQEVAAKPTNRDVSEPSHIAALRTAHPSYFDVTDSVASPCLYLLDRHEHQNTVIPLCEESAWIFSTLFTTLAANGKWVVHVLEVGCGTGMLTQDLVDILPEFPSPVTEYVTTDISLGLAMQAAQCFSHPYMHAATYDFKDTQGAGDLSVPLPCRGGTASLACDHHSRPQDELHLGSAHPRRLHPVS